MKTVFTFLLFSIFLFPFSALHADDGKNVLEVWEGNVPIEAETLLKTKADKWNFGFRPLSSTSTSWFWSDPIMQQRALSGETGEKEYPTAITAAWNHEGFSLVVYTVQPDLKEQLAKGSVPDGSFELYFAEGDNDTRELKPYYQFWISAEGGGKRDNYPWTVYDRYDRNPNAYLQYRVRTLDNGYVHVITFPWEAFWDRLPFADRKDNFWRLGLTRFTPQAWLTWGGKVHEASRFGYLRFPRFTAADRTKIRENLLKRAWVRFLAVKNTPNYNTPSAWGAPWPLDGRFLEEERAKVPETYWNYTQDPDFHPVLAKLNAERMPLAAEIARFAEMSEEEQTAFYVKAADRLFNYRYDVEKAYTAFMNERIFK